LVAQAVRISDVGWREFGRRPGEIVALEQLGFQRFANTNLDLQIKIHGIHRLIVMDR